MKKLTERIRNQKRFDRLSQEKKEMLNKIALKQFRLHVRLRDKPVDILDRIDFN